MNFNSEELATFAEAVGDHEGRLTHKPPPRTLYDSACKERWFKLKANLLFYYKLNEHGGIDKNEPRGVFVLENFEVQMERTFDAPFGFAIRWKDDMEKKHLFFAQSEGSAYTWVSKLIHASYEHMRAQMVMMRVQIRRKTGKDPMEHFGTPPLQRPSRTATKCKSQFHVDLEEGSTSLELPEGSLTDSARLYTKCKSKFHVDLEEILPRSTADSSRLMVSRSPERTSHSIHGVPSWSTSAKINISKSPSLKEPVRPAPVPPPRRGKKQNQGDGHTVVSDLVPDVGCGQATFQCHLGEECLPSTPNNLLD